MFIADIKQYSLFFLKDIQVSCSCSTISFVFVRLPTNYLFQNLPCFFVKGFAKKLPCKILLNCFQTKGNCLSPVDNKLYMKVFVRQERKCRKYMIHHP